ncbi:IS1380 family transposase [Luteococcus sp.]|uniref:IS1380 family transposase n=1 Tax=Luteococcus sp. TaxID=1969402 RepID=UPI003735C706
MNKRSRMYPCVRVDRANVPAVGQAGGVLLTRTVQASGLGLVLSQALGLWRKPLAKHDPAKVLLDLAMSLVLGGDSCRDAALLRSEPGIYGPVASDPTISRTITALAADVDRVEKAVAKARAAARDLVWGLADDKAPGHDATADKPVIIDLDATLVTSHSDKEQARATFKNGYGFHPLLAFVDHGPDGTGEPVAGLLRAGNAGSNTASDHETVIRSALKQVPGINPSRPGRTVLIRTDGAGGSKQLLGFLSSKGVSYSIGFTLPMSTPELYHLIPETAWQDAYNADGQVRDGAAVVEFTDLLQSKGSLNGYPSGMRVIVRRERPHPGAQLRFDDVDGYRLTAFVTNTRTGQLADLEMRHRRRARCEDRIRTAKDTGLSNLPLQGFNQNRIWLLIVQLAGDLLAWMAMLALQGPARRWEPKTLRHRLFTMAATLAHTGRRTILHLKQNNPWSTTILDGWNRLAALTPP